MNGDVNDPKVFDEAVKNLGKNGGKIDRDFISDSDLNQTIIKRESIEYSNLEINRKILQNMESIKRGVLFFVVLAILGLIATILNYAI